MKFLLSLLFLICPVICQEPLKAVFDLVETGRFEVQPGEVILKEISGPAGKFYFEAGFVKVNRDGESNVGSHYQIYGRNMGDMGQLERPDHAAHVRSIVVIYKDPTVPDTGRVFQYGRDNQVPCIHYGSSFSYGLRDGWLQEPTASFVSEGNIFIAVLDNRGPYEIYPAKWQSTLNGTKGEDPLSATTHRWKGGFMKLWDLIVTKKGHEVLIDTDPMPPMDISWYALTKTDINPQYPPYIKRLYNSIDYAPLNFDGDIEYGSTDHGLLWWIFQGEGRHKYWNYQNKIKLIDYRSHAVGWKHWLDLQWAEGHYNNPYNWPLIVFRRWAHTRSDISWFLLTRMVKWNATSGIVWSSDMVNGKRVPRLRGGYSWYEKGTRGYEVGSSYWPMEYKQYSESILLSSLIYPNQFWSKDGISWHGENLLSVMAYDKWNGKYGERIPGWGIMNASAYYAYTKDEKFKTYARAIIDNCIKIMKDPARISAEKDQKWKNTSLGVPYIYDNNVVSSNSPEGSYWQTAKLVLGMVTYSIQCQDRTYDPKILQMTQFLMEEGLVQVGPYYVSRNRFTKDRIMAQYFDGNKGGQFNIINPQTTEWWILPVGYCAKVLGDPKAIEIFPQLVSQAGIFTDWPIDLIITYFPELANVEIDGSSFVKVDTTGLDSSLHRIRAVNDVDEVYFGSFRIISATEIEVLNLPIGNYKTLIFTGPWLSYVKSNRDKAIKSVTFNHTLRVPVATSKFDWSNGLHHNTWPKIVEQALTQGDWPYIK